MAIFIIHGVQGHPEENWFPWLKRELEGRGEHVIVPQFPTPENQTLEQWTRVLKTHREFLTPETIFVGHSLGVPFILNILETYRANAAFLVAAFVGKAGNPFDKSMATFAQRSFDWERIRQNCPHFQVFHSDNDPYIKLESAEEVAQKLGVEIRLIPQAGHFNTASGYTKFEALLERIVELR